MANADLHAWHQPPPAARGAPSFAPVLAGGVAQLAALLRVARDSRPLRDVAFLMIVLGMSSFVPVWIIQLYAVHAGVSKVFLGPIWSVANYSVAVASLLRGKVARQAPLALLRGKVARQAPLAPLPVLTGALPEGSFPPGLPFVPHRRAGPIVP